MNLIETGVNCAVCKQPLVATSEYYAECVVFAAEICQRYTCGECSPESARMTGDTVMASYSALFERNIFTVESAPVELSY